MSGVVVSISPVEYCFWPFLQGYLMEYSLLFYGYYDNKSIAIDTDVGVYNLPLAFLLTTGAILLISFILVSRK